MVLIVELEMSKKAPVKRASTLRSVPVPIADLNKKNTEHAFRNELANKNNLLVLDALRNNGINSDNSLIRAMQLDKPLFADDRFLAASLTTTTVRGANGEFKTQTIQQPPAKTTRDLVARLPGAALVSRGVLPSSIPASYAAYPTTVDWRNAELKHRALQSELDELEDTIREKEAALRNNSSIAGSASGFDDSFSSSKMKATFMDTLQKNPRLMAAQLAPKAGSGVWGSSFRWKGLQDESTNERVHCWPDSYKFGGYPIQKSEYGPNTKECDVPGGSVYIIKGARGRKQAPPSR